MPRKSKFDDGYIRQLVDGANACRTNKERKAFLVKNNIRLDNLRRMASNRGWTLTDPNPTLRANLQKAARRHWKKRRKRTHSQRVKAGIRRSGLRVSDPVKVLIAHLARMENLKNEVRKVITDLETAFESLKKSVE